MCEFCGCGRTDHAHGHDSKTIEVQQDVLNHNREHASNLRNRLGEMKSHLVNIIGSPGCGKTELLAALIGRINTQRKCIVIEGDLATDNDAVRISKTGAPVRQIQTGTACHLTAHDVEHALGHLPLEKECLVLVENVGNLVCPSMFDLGESMRIVCLSVTEGTDKPQKYPVSFREADSAVITKSDLMPHVDFDAGACTRMIQQVKPSVPVVLTSARTGEGIEELSGSILKLYSD